MTIDELRRAVEQRTGVPAALLTGETEEELEAQAAALQAYRRRHTQNDHKNTRALFAAWLAQIEDEGAEEWGSL